MKPSSFRLTCAFIAVLPALAFAGEEHAATYDIRVDTSEATRALRENYRAANANHARRAADLHATMARGQAALAARVPQVRVDANPLTHLPEIVDSEASALTAPSGAKHEAVMRKFVTDNAAFFGLSAKQAAQLKTNADYANPAGNLSWVELEQVIHGIPVFQGTIRAALGKDGAIARTTGNLAAGLDEASLPTTPKLSPAAAAAAAAGTINVEVDAKSLRVQTVKNDGRTKILSKGPFTQEIQTDLVYFPLEPGVATLAYSLVLWQPVKVYYMIVDAQTGRVLWRKNITNDQTQTATFSVYNDDSPTPLSPTTATPGSATIPAAIARTTFTFVSELPAFDNLGWITNGGNTTTGNNVDAGLDIDNTNGIDANGRPVGSPNRTFNFAYTPAGQAGAQAPTLPAYRNGIVTNLFFWSNRYHDRLYSYGFTEAARNFQGNNFGRGGAGGDFVRAEAQDAGGTNNANFATPPDGQLPRMQMYIFDQPNPQRDGDLDQEVVLHELTHGLSNRLHANGSGLATNQAGGMGEGWSDFYARCLLSSAAENVDGVYASGGYVTLNFFGLGTDNYYYGIRRFPYAVKTALGVNGLPHNPMTFGDIDPAQNFLTDGAFPMSPIIGATATEVHNIGEIWCMALLEMRARIVKRLGFPAGNDRTLQIVTDGMKLDPASPTVAQARDAIIAADKAGFAGADVADIWAGFAAMGLGFNSTAIASAQFPAAITESYITPNILLGNVTFSDALGNGNGFADPNETIVLTVPIRNILPGTAVGATATVDGVTVSYGDIATGQTVTKDFQFTVPLATPSGTRLAVPVIIDSSLGPVGPRTPTFPLVVGEPLSDFAENFDQLTGTALPVGWSTTTTGSGVPWVVSTTNSDTPTRNAFTPDVASDSTAELQTPDIAITSPSATLTFRNSYNLEADTFNFYDGMVLEISVDGGGFQDVVAAGCVFLSGGYNSCPGGFSGWSGLSGGTTAAPAYITTSLLLPPSVENHTVSFKWTVFCDFVAVASGSAGARIDSVVIFNGTRSIVPGDTPVVTTSPGVVPYVENQPSTVIDNGITVTDDDSPVLFNANVAITANFATGEDVLSFNPPPGITGSYNAGTGVLKMKGDVPPSAYQAAFRSVRYFNTSDNPSTLQRTVTFTANDGAESGFATRDISVTAVNDAPIGNSVNVLTNEDTAKSFSLTGVDPENSPTTFTITKQPQHGQLTGTLPNITYTPDLNYNGPDNFSFKLNDGQLDSVADANVNISIVAVNDPPVADAQSGGTNEDTAVAIQLTGSDVEGSPISFAIVDLPTYGLLSGSVPNLTYTPNANYFGPDTFTFLTNDGTLDGPKATVSINVAPVNDPPTFTVGPDQVVINDTTLKSITPWATGVSPGPGESGQKINFTVLADQPGLFTTQPAVAADGTLTFQAAADVFGITQVTITGHDDGGLANGGIDTTAAQTFKLLVNPANFAPTFAAGPDVIVPRGSGAYSQPWASNADPGAPHESTQALNFLVQFDHPELFIAAPAISPAGVLTFTPAAGASGLSNITVRLHDDGGTVHNGIDTSDPQTFTIAVATFVEEVGTYNGLIQPAGKTVHEQGRYGNARVTVAATGAITAKIELGGKKYSVKGFVDLVGSIRFGKTATVTAPLPRPGLSALALALQLDVSKHTDTLLGTFTDGSTPFASLSTDRALYTAKTNPTAPFTNPPKGLLGRYTAIFGAQTSAASGLPSDVFPQGDGIGFVKISPTGRVKITGTLADGSRVSFGNALSKANVLPFHILTDKKKGSVTGPIAFHTGGIVFAQPDAPANDVDGFGLVWIRPNNLQAKVYPAGWPNGIGLDLIGSAYVPANNAAALPGLGMTGPKGNAEIDLFSGGLAIGGLAKGANIDPKNKVLVVNPSADKLKLTINPKTGALNGNFIFPVSDTPTQLHGVILQKSSRGAGYFVSPIASGHLSVTPAP